MVQRHKERKIWEDKISPPRRYFDNKPLGKVLLQEIAPTKVEKECNRTNEANSLWFYNLIQSGMQYKPLTRIAEMKPTLDVKEMSVTTASSEPDFFNSTVTSQ